MLFTFSSRQKKKLHDKSHSKRNNKLYQNWDKRWKRREKNGKEWKHETRVRERKKIKKIKNIEEKKNKPPHHPYVHHIYLSISTEHWSSFRYECQDFEFENKPKQSRAEPIWARSHGIEKQRRSFDKRKKNKKIELNWNELLTNGLNALYLHKCGSV